MQTLSPHTHIIIFDCIASRVERPPLPISSPMHSVSLIVQVLWLLLSQQEGVLCLVVPGKYYDSTGTIQWAEYFNGPAGPPDPKNWVHDIGTGHNGWGNNDLEYYTDELKNARLDGNGHLVITALRDNSHGTGYTSARLRSVKTDFQYGRFEINMKIPKGNGLWPAFWMVGPGAWPTGGEIDIMENVGKFPRKVYGSLHAGDSWNDNHKYQPQVGHDFSADLGDDFHLYSVDWTHDSVTFYLDGEQYAQFHSSQAGGKWYFNKGGFHMILNLAVGGGGGWNGPPDNSTPFPAQLIVNYIIVYNLKNAPADANNNNDNSRRGLLAREYGQQPMYGQMPPASFYPNGYGYDYEPSSGYAPEARGYAPQNSNNSPPSVPNWAKVGLAFGAGAALTALATNPTVREASREWLDAAKRGQGTQKAQEIGRRLTDALFAKGGAQQPNAGEHDERGALIDMSRGQEEPGAKIVFG